MVLVDFLEDLLDMEEMFGQVPVVDEDIVDVDDDELLEELPEDEVPTNDESMRACAETQICGVKSCKVEQNSPLGEVVGPGRL